MANGTTDSKEGNFRHWLAGGITAVSIIGVVVLAAIMVIKGSTQAQFVLATVLPVIGTWVGTVLAYYFSRENLEAATRSVTAIARQLTPEEKLKSKAAKDVMIPKDQMFFVRGPAATVNLVKALADLEQADKGSRVPVLDKGDLPLYVVHRSTIDRFLVEKARASPAPGLGTHTLQDMLTDAQIKPLLESSFATVNESATLADAKTAMDASRFCQDVFITQTGAKTDPVLGWITNVIIEDYAKV
jgi:hypothetical protein